MAKCVDCKTYEACKDSTLCIGCVVCYSVPRMWRGLVWFMAGMAIFKYLST